jgi:serine/threonine-protein kinase
MSATTPFVLPPDVMITPVAELSALLRKQLGSKGSEFAVSRPHARTASKLLDRDGAELLAVFRTPMTIAEAVVTYCGKSGGDPRDVATRAFPLLLECVNFGLLVPADSELAHPIAPSLESGARIARARVIRCMSLSNDTEVFELREAGGAHRCLKIARAPYAAAAAAQLSHEAAILRHLGGSAAPKFVREGVTDDRPFLVTSWCEGTPPDAVAIRYREEPEPRGRRKLLALALSIAEAYATLHARRVLHGDVHPGNILVSPRGTIVVLDFGAARLASRRDGLDALPRAGVAFFREPAWAAAARAKRRVPPATAAGEQYAVAALLFLLLTGHHYLEFSLDERTMLGQIANEPPQSFADCGLPPWPELERILVKALNKEPERRFRSMRQLSDALRAVKLRGVRAAPLIRGGGIARFAEGVVERLAADGALFRDGLTPPPTSSVHLGASGIAFALYRIACVRDDPALLSLADLWNAKALHALHERDAFYNDREGLTESVIGRSSLYHSPVGTHLVGASIGHALGDSAARDAALRQFVLAARGSGAQLDVAFGKSGILVACAMIFGMSEPGKRSTAAVASLGRRNYRALTSRIVALPPIAENRRLVNLGVAHGWAGMLYAIMRWCDVTRTAPPAWLPLRLRELAALGSRVGKGTRWPWRDQLGAAAASMPGWCNGSAGFVHLWTLAHATCGDARHLELAERAGWSAWEGPGRAWDLCCGSAGRAYALLNLYRHTGERVWLERAHRLAVQAVSGARRAERESSNTYPNSLIRGLSGVAVLAEELSRVEDARMPMFELEPWPAPRTVGAL